jgi:hypothetical protein
MGCLLYTAVFVTVIFIILKLVKIISWSWLLVISPIWIVVGIIIIAVIINKLDDWMGGY